VFVGFCGFFLFCLGFCFLVLVRCFLCTLLCLSLLLIYIYHHDMVLHAIRTFDKAIPRFVISGHHILFKNRNIKVVKNMNASRQLFRFFRGIFGVFYTEG
jgi:hypothetical protein